MKLMYNKHVIIYNKLLDFNWVRKEEVYNYSHQVNKMNQVPKYKQLIKPFTCIDTVRFTNKKLRFVLVCTEEDLYPRSRRLQ